MSVLCGMSTAMGQGLHTWMFLLYGPFISIVVCVRLVGGWLPDSWTWPHSKLPAPQANISEAHCQRCESVQVWLNKVVQFIQEKKMQNKLLNLHYLCHQIKIVLFVHPLLHHRLIAYIWIDGCQKYVLQKTVSVIKRKRGKKYASFWIGFRTHQYVKLERH